MHPDNILTLYARRESAIPTTALPSFDIDSQIAQGFSALDGAAMSETDVTALVDHICGLVRHGADSMLAARLGCSLEEIAGLPVTERTRLMEKSTHIGIIMLNGVSGGGKSTLLANLAQDNRTDATLDDRHPQVICGTYGVPDANPAFQEPLGGYPEARLGPEIITAKVIDAMHRNGFENIAMFGGPRQLQGIIGKLFADISLTQEHWRDINSAINEFVAAYPAGTMVNLDVATQERTRRINSSDSEFRKMSLLGATGNLIEKMIDLYAEQVLPQSLHLQSPPPPGYTDNRQPGQKAEREILKMWQLHHGDERPLNMGGLVEDLVALKRTDEIRITPALNTLSAAAWRRATEKDPEGVDLATQQVFAEMQQFGIDIPHVRGYSEPSFHGVQRQIVSEFERLSAEYDAAGISERVLVGDQQNLVVSLDHLMVKIAAARGIVLQAEINADYPNRNYRLVAEEADVAIVEAA